MEFFRDSKIDFMKYRRFWVSVSTLLVTLSLVVVFGVGGLNIGIDFAGGTQITLIFRDQPDIEVLRGLLEDGGIESSGIQRFGVEADNEVIIKTPVIEGAEEGSQTLVVDAFDKHFNPDRKQSFDLNQRGTEALVSLLEAADPDGVSESIERAPREHYTGVAEAIMTLRREDGLIRDLEQLTALPEVSDAVAQVLQEQGYVGNFAVLAAENVGPQIGSELRSKGIWAVGLSLLGMLAYMWIRFELRFGIGALVALVHDVAVTLGLYALLGYEFNLATIAGFLTVVGYSVNDSVVIFDRVRENLRRTRREPLGKVLNQSLNQTLSRTVLTSGTTLLVVGTLFIFGGDVIRGLAFVLLTGVVLGTYSSIFIASPFVLMWERLVKGKGTSTAKAAL